MAATAEFTPELFEGERYCGSLADEYEYAGALALRASGIEIRPLIIEGIVENAWDNHLTALTENVATDDEFIENLVFGTPKRRKIVDGKVVSKNGRPVIDIVRNGAKHSAKLAETDETYQHQATRDEGDVILAETFDGLEIGEFAHATSMDPKDWYITHPELCDSIGYRRGMAVQHLAYRQDKDTMLTWTYAIKQSDKNAIAQIYREDFGVNIPENTHSDMWIRNIHRGKMPIEWVEQIGRRTLQRHKEITGSAITHYSVDEFMEENRELIKGYFDAYWPAISEAVATKNNNPILQDFASNIINSAGKRLKPEVVSKLLRVANIKSFDDDSGRLMKIMVRYATHEELRAKIPDYMARIDQEAEVKGVEVVPHRVVAEYFYSPQIAYVDHARMQEMSMVMAQNIGVGVEARRSSGGCSGGVSIAQDEPGITNLRNNMFGRVDNDASETSVVMGKDGKGPLTFTCTKGHPNTREDGKPLIPKCKSCGEKVGCVPGENEHTKREETNVVWLFQKSEKSKQLSKVA